MVRQSGRGWVKNFFSRTSKNLLKVVTVMEKKKCPGNDNSDENESKKRKIDDVDTNSQWFQLKD